MSCAVRLVIVIVCFFAFIEGHSEAPERRLTLQSPRVLARVSQPNLPFRMAPVGNNLIVMGQGRFWKLPLESSSVVSLSEKQAFGLHYWGFSLAARGDDSALACVDGGNRLLLIDKISNEGLPQLTEHRFDINQQDSCGGVSAGASQDQVWVAGLQNHTLIEMRKKKRGWKVESRVRGYSGAFLHAVLQNHLVGLWGSLSPDHFGAFVFDPKTPQFLLAPLFEDRAADQKLPSQFADDLALASSFVLFVQPALQRVTKVKIFKNQAGSEVIQVEDIPTRLLTPYQVETTSKCALVLGSLDERGTSAVEWVSWSGESLSLQELTPQAEAKESLRYIVLHQGRLFGSDSRGVIEYTDFQVPQDCQ